MPVPAAALSAAILAAVPSCRQRHWARCALSSQSNGFFRSAGLLTTSCAKRTKSSNCAPMNMDGTQQTAIHEALVAVQHAVTSMTFPSCDQEDLIELIDRIEEQLHLRHPNVA